MKPILITAFLGLAAAAAPLQAQTTDESIADKVEFLGDMDNLSITDLRVVRQNGLLRIQ